MKVRPLAPVVLGVFGALLVSGFVAETPAQQGRPASVAPSPTDSSAQGKPTSMAPGS